MDSLSTSLANASMRTSLNDLPEELILDIITHLPHASHIANLSQTSRYAHSIVERAGWKKFSRQSLPSLSLDGTSASPGRVLADRLTYLDMCWEKRAFVYHSYKESAPPRAGRRWKAKQTVGFYPVLDGGLVGQGDELVAWGAGEDLVTRYTPCGPSSQHQWNRLEGKSIGQSAGFGDITALSVLDRGSGPEALVGRANGQMRLSTVAGEDFGKLGQQLLPHEQTVESHHAKVSRMKIGSPAQVAISATQWHPENNLIASCQGSSLTLYDLSDPDSEYIQSMAQYDMATGGPDDELSLLKSAKFLGKSNIACALGNTRNPLRFGTMTPSGLVFPTTSESPDTRPWDVFGSLDAEGKTAVRAIETVGNGASESLLLSAWDDGTFRLTDRRTPSSYVMMYRDRCWQTYDSASSLLVYGTQRFVAGGKSAANVRIYDFRNPKPYHYTDALPCIDKCPPPIPPYDHSPGYTARARCSGLHKCTYHFQSRRDVYRPDVTLYMGDASVGNVYSLAKTSDIASSFFVGTQGAVTEVGLKLAEDVTAKGLMSKNAPEGWRVGKPSGTIAMSEDGMGACVRSEWRMETQGFLGLKKQNRHARKRDYTRRLDSAYYD